VTEDPGLKTVYLFGAGASLPAGLDVICSSLSLSPGLRVIIDDQ